MGTPALSYVHATLAVPDEAYSLFLGSGFNVCDKAPRFYFLTIDPQRPRPCLEHIQSAATQFDGTLEGFRRPYACAIEGRHLFHHSPAIFAQVLFGDFGDHRNPL